MTRVPSPAGPAPNFVVAAPPPADVLLAADAHAREPLPADVASEARVHVKCGSLTARCPRWLEFCREVGSPKSLAATTVVALAKAE